jgi:hypothetical protein
MNVQALGDAIVSPAQIAGIGHPLAAANHRQWIRWEYYVLREPDLLVPDGAAAIIAAATGDGLEDVLILNAQSAIAIVRRQVGAFAYAPRLELIIDRKRQQFTNWVNYAVTKTAGDRTRWLLQCRTPFLALTPQMQKSDYVEAEADLSIIAEACGLVLARDRPALVPQTPRHLRRLRGRHALGFHGAYRDYEQPWTGSCLGCHASWSMIR